MCVCVCMHNTYTCVYVHVCHFLCIPNSGHLKETLKEFIERRVKLKLAENLAEHLAQKVHRDISDKEEKLRREYEDKMRR